MQKAGFFSAFIGPYFFFGRFTAEFSSFFLSSLHFSKEKQNQKSLKNLTKKKKKEKEKQMR